MAKPRCAIAAEDVSRVFDDKRIEVLARIAKLPAGADRQHFGESIREAARIYARDSHEPNVNELHKEIGKLNRAAERQQFDQLAMLIEGLSFKARNLLNARGARPNLKVTLPPPKALRGAQREEACATIAKLTQFGGQYVEGRMRPTGKRSRPTWQPVLYAPEPKRHLPKREAEKYFIALLQAAWAEATGEQPTTTARPGMLGPFPKMVEECLRLAGAGHADVVDLLNDMNTHRKKLSSIKARTLRLSV
jgi:hypothetical protein